MSSLAARSSIFGAPPPVLYHYTDQRGLLGIFETRELWASHSQYMNDQEEFRFALGLIREELAVREAILGKSDLFAKVQDEIDSEPERANVCVCSFSSKKDDLAQWRAYGSGSGFAIGFEGAWLREIAQSEDARL